MTQYLNGSCPACRRSIRVRVEYLGKRLECKSCGARYLARTKDGTPTGELVFEIKGSPLNLSTAPAKPEHPAPTLEEELEILRKEVLSRDLTLQSALDRLRETQDEFTRRQEEVEKLRQEHDEALAKAQQAEELGERAKQTERELGELRGERDRLQVELQALRSDLVEPQASATGPAASEPPPELLAELDQQRTRIRELEQRLTEAEQPQADLHADMPSPELVAACAERDKLRKKVQQLEGKLEKARSEADAGAKFEQELAILRTEHARLEEDRVHACQTAEELHVQLLELEPAAAEAPTLRERLAALETLPGELVSLQALRQQRELELEETRQQLMAAREECRRLREVTAQLAALQPAHEQLRGQYETAVIELTETRERLAELETLRPELDRLRTGLHQAELQAAELETARGELARLVDELTTVRAALTQTRSEYEQLRTLPQQLAVREAECEMLRSERAQALANVGALERTAAEHEQQLARLRAALEATQQEAQADADRERREALEEKRRLEQSWSEKLREREHLAEAEVHAERARAAEAVKALQQELEQARATLAGQGAEHQTAVGTITRERDELRAERSGVEKLAREAQRRLDTERTTSAHAIEEARRERALAQERLQVALQRLQDLEADQASAPQRLAEQAAEIGRLQQELQHARLERDAAAADQSDLAEKLHTRESEFSSLNQREEDYQAELARLRQALTQTRQQRDLAAQAQEELQEQIQNLQRQLDVVQPPAGQAGEGSLQLSALNARLLAMTSERDDWRRRCTDAERQFDEERQSLHLQIDRLQKQLNSLRQVLQGLGIHT